MLKQSAAKSVPIQWWQRPGEFLQLFAPGFLFLPHSLQCVCKLLPACPGLGALLGQRQRQFFFARRDEIELLLELRMTRRSRRKMIAKLIQRIKQLVEVQCSLLRSGFCFRRRAAGNAGRNPTFRRGRRPSPTIRRGWGLYSGLWPLQAEVPRVVTGRTAEVVPDPFGAGAAHTPQEAGRPQADRFVAPRAFDAGGDRGVAERAGRLSRGWRRDTNDNVPPDFRAGEASLPKGEQLGVRQPTRRPIERIVQDDVLRVDINENRVMAS